MKCVRETEILVEQQPPQGVFVCDHAGLVIDKFSSGGWTWRATSASGTTSRASSSLLNPSTLERNAARPVSCPPFVLTCRVPRPAFVLICRVSRPAGGRGYHAARSNSSSTTATSLPSTLLAPQGWNLLSKHRHSCTKEQKPTPKIPRFPCGKHATLLNPTIFKPVRFVRRWGGRLRWHGSVFGVKFDGQI